MKEVIIIICLLVVIILLCRDKVVINRIVKGGQREGSVKGQLPELMGRPRELRRQVAPNSATKRQLGIRPKTAGNFESEAKNKIISKVIPREELDEVFSEQADLSEEQEDLIKQGAPNGDDGFATGVTFEELSLVGKVLQQRLVGPEPEQRAADVVQRIQGTELFSLLESSMADASAKIATLLDKRVSEKMDSGSSSLRNDLDEFDIGHFV